LIEHVSHHPCLYGSQNAQYKNVINFLIKTQAKAKIASNFANFGNAIDMIRLIVNLLKNYFFITRSHLGFCKVAAFEN
jgi:hypothetical protein